ncbi:D-2-hydroxyacid dehydrogenase [Chloroflexus sp.]|uniref:D-2-hydroxyacid dehydrogenase n=1 Tax=Chloroflexus sp. TaxID=1904827 RepID=UPI00298F2CA6|nr:D-2-hydroxyacid dehydrogenase [Chloroflexus sp.]MDW8406057.1 D-2-hydroxyacid dehydrogenase [Chloroflexus sp.]
MKLVLPGLLRDELIPRMAAVAPQATIVWYDQNGEPEAPIADAEVLLRWFFPAEQLARLVRQMPALRWLHIPRAGVDGSLIPDVIERDIIVTNSAGVHAIPISEFVMLFALSHVKQAARLHQLQAAHQWREPDMQLRELAGATMLIIGLGQIGQAIAERASAFGMRVWGSRRHPRPMAGVERVVGEGEWRSLLPEADFVVIAAPLTPLTRGMFGRAELALMKPDAYLINIARGEIVDEAALIAALRERRIAGAGLDVFAHEPLPPDNPLWELPNVFVTPHISWSSPHIRARTLDIFAYNLRALLNNEPMMNVVDKQAGY